MDDFTDHHCWHHKCTSFVHSFCRQIATTLRTSLILLCPQQSRCNELMVLGKYLKVLEKYLKVLEKYLNVLAKVLACTFKVHGSKYGRIGRRIKPYVQTTGTWTVEMPAMSVHGPSM